MAGTTKAPSSLGDVVTLGEQLGTALQGIVETFLDEEEPIWILRDITSEIHSTASTLRRLQDKIRIHNSSNENCRVFKEEGLKEIWDLSLKCGKTYETILALADKAVCLKAGGEGKEVLTFNINVRNRLDVGLLEPLSWHPLSRCRAQLRWVNYGLQLNLHLASIARIQLCTEEKTFGAFEEEAALRAMAVSIRAKEKRAGRQLIRDQKKFEEEDADSDTDSDSTSGGSVSTGVSSGKGSVLEKAIDDGGDSEKNSNIPSSVPTTIEIDRPVSPETPKKKPESVTSDTSSAKTLTPDTEVSTKHTDKSEAIKSTTGKPTTQKEETSFASQDNKQAIPPGKAPNQISSRITSVGNLTSNQQKDIPPFLQAALGSSTNPKPTTLLSRLKSLASKFKINIHSPKESKSLEAFIILPTPRGSPEIIHLPFGSNALEELQKMQPQSFFEKYTTMTPAGHRYLYKAIGDIERWDFEKRTYLYLGRYSDTRRLEGDIYLLFYKKRERSKKEKGEDEKWIIFKDAVGRKFLFPVEECRSWVGMSSLVKQAFLHVEVIGPQVHKEHYDLIGPEGNIILPSLWERTVKPGWTITQHMWPLPPAQARPPPPPQSTFKVPPPPPPQVQPPPPPPPIFKRVKDENEIFANKALTLDIEKEEESLKLSVGTLLARFTNSTDTDVDGHGCVVGDSEESGSESEDESLW